MLRVAALLSSLRVIVLESSNFRVFEGQENTDIVCIFREEFSGSKNRLPPYYGSRKKNIKKSKAATKVSFEAPIGPFLGRLDTFSITRLLKITPVLLFF